MAKAQLALQWIALVAIGSLTLADVASIVANDDNVNVNVNVNASASAIVSCDIPNESVRGRCLPPTRCASFLKVLNETSSAAAPQPESLRFLEKVKCESESGSTAEVCCPVNGRDYAHPAVEVMRDVSQRTLSFSRSRNKTKKLKRRIQTVPSTGEYNLFNECGKQVTNRIYGGEIAELDEYPWLALLVYNSNDFGCSGALIDDRHVLTAAHCVQGVRVREKNGLKSVRLGEFNVKTEPDCIKEQNYLNCNNPALDMNVDRIFVHPEYDENSVNKFNDISVIRLQTAVPFTHFVMPICLPGVADREERPFKPGHMFSVSGWGQTDLFNKYYPDIQSPIKLKLRVPLVGSEVCSKILKVFGVQVGPKQICAGGEMAKDTCAGDSGGPLMYFSRKHSRWVAYGIVSYGFTQCGMAGHPAVYTNVSAYIDWIGEVTKS